jgi:hypothetical protein
MLRTVALFFAYFVCLPHGSDILTVIHQQRLGVVVGACCLLEPADRLCVGFLRHHFVALSHVLQGAAVHTTGTQKRLSAHPRQPGTPTNYRVS